MLGFYERDMYSTSTDPGIWYGIVYTVNRITFIRCKDEYNSYIVAYIRCKDGYSSDIVAGL